MATVARSNNAPSTHTGMPTRPILRHRISNTNTNPPPIPPSLIHNPLLQSPNSPFRRNPAMSPGSPASSSMHDALGLLDTLPADSSSRNNMSQRGNAAGGSDTGSGMVSRSVPSNNDGRSSGEMSLKPRSVSIPTRPSLPIRTPSYNKRIQQQNSQYPYHQPMTNGCPPSSFSPSASSLSQHQGMTPISVPGQGRAPP